MWSGGPMTVSHVVLHDVHETMLDLAKRDYSLAALGGVAQITCDVVPDLNLHGRLVEVDIAAVVQFKAHHKIPVKPVRIAAKR